MPTLTEDEIKARIADGTISAVSIDTAVFYGYGYRLDAPVLSKLDQFKSSPIALLFSEIVVSEIKSHITRDALESQRELKRAIRKQCGRWKTKVDLDVLPDSLALTSDPAAAADSQLEDYLKSIGGKVVPANGEANVTAELLRRYFATEPPFESGDKKKHEFPDGFALLSLEEVARLRKKLILCVSPDKGWNKFSAQSNHLVCVSDLELVLSYFNDSGRNVADQTMDMWKRGLAHELIQEIEGAFERRLDDLEFHPDASSAADFEAYPIGAVLQAVDASTATAPVVIAADDQSVTFTTTVEANVAFEAEFNFFVTDAIDRDHVSLGEEYYSVEERNDFQLAITVLRDLEPEPQVVEAELTKRDLWVNFGYVEPFRGEDPTHEKY
jgi:hypothetical protein